jgi:hypothetical protein
MAIGDVVRDGPVIRSILWNQAAAGMAAAAYLNMP